MLVPGHSLRHAHVRDANALARAPATALTVGKFDIWPEYNQHGPILNHYWGQLYDVFPEWQFFLCDPGTGEVPAEGHTIPVAWDG
jgi:hypothetical protein